MTTDKTMRIVTQQNYVFENYPGREFKMPSKTVPDQSFTVRQVMDRYAKGLPITGVNKEAVYHGDDSMLGIDTSKLDMAELQELRLQVSDQVKETFRKAKEKKTPPEPPKPPAEPNKNLESAPLAKGPAEGDQQK